MSFLEPVRGLVWEIVAGAVVSYAVPWLSEFVQRKIPPLWERYWPLFYQTILVPAFHLVSDTFAKLVSGRLFNREKNVSAESVSESPPTLPQGGTMLPDQKTLDRPPDPVAHAVTNISNGPPSDHEDITGTSVSDHRALLEGGTMESPLDQNILVRPSDDTVLHSVASISSSLSSDDEDITVTSGSEPHTLLEGGKVESPLDQNILAPLDSVLHTATNISEGLPLDHEEMTVTSVSEPHTLLEAVAVEGPLDQNILVQASDSISNSSSDISSDHDDTTVISVSDSATVTEGGTPASVDVDFFGEYSEGSRYRIEEVIGKGSHGLVCSAYDTHLGEKVAIKKISDIFRHVSDATRILREIKLLRLLSHPDIVEIKHILLPPSIREFKDIYVVFELMECDLRALIKANDDMTPERCRFFLYQLLRGLKYIHTANVFHRDLNPKNILAIADCKLQIRHFSHAFIDTPTAIFWTDYVATRWYKAPELCGQFFSKYSPAVDIWSMGCIFAELLSGKPLFPGENAGHQLELITNLLGTPSPEFIAKIRNEKARTSMSSMPKKKPIPFFKKFPNADPLALRLLERMLAFDPEHRPSAEEALAHPYLKDFARVEREPSAHPVAEAEFEFERLDVTKEDLRELIYREILENYPQTSKKLEHFEHYPQTSKKQEFFLEAAEAYATMHSFSHSKTKRLLAKVASITPKKLLHHPS